MITESCQNMVDGKFRYKRMFCSKECKEDFHERAFLDRVDDAVSKAQTLMEKQLAAERAKAEKEFEGKVEELQKEKKLLYEAMCPADKRRFVGWMQKRKKS